MAAAATEMGDRPGTISNSTAFLAMCVAALCTIFGRPRLEQNLDIKSPVVMRSTEVSRAFRINLKHLPISRLLILLTAQISLNVRGTPSCLQAMYKQADAIASLERPKNYIYIVIHFLYIHCKLILFFMETYFIMMQYYLILTGAIFSYINHTT